MTARTDIEYRRREPDESLIRSGILPSARTWQDLAALANWLSGTGACVVSGHAVDAAVMKCDGSAYTLRYRTKPRAIPIFRIWALHLRVYDLDDAGASVSITAPAATGTALVVPLALDRATSPIYYLEVVTVPAATEQELNIKLVASGSGNLAIDCVRCYELTRASLPVPTGVNVTTERPGERIYAGSGVSVLGVASVLTACDPRRVAIFHWAVPDTAPITRSGAYVSMFPLGVPVLTRKIAKNATKGTVYWSVYAKVGSGNGDVKLTTSDSAASDSVNITNTSFAWTTARAISIDCDDMDSADGLPGFSTWDELTVQIRGNGGVTLSIAGISIWEA